MKTKLALLLVIVLLGLAACAPAAQMSAPEAAYDQGFGGSAPMVSEERAMVESESYTQDSSNVAAERLVIKNANLSIAVDAPLTTRDEIARMAEEMGGFVVSSNSYETTNSEGQQFPRANITIRVPADRLSEALERIKQGAGEVLTENESGQDVTQDYTDQKSRLRNLEDTEKQLREIMASAQKTEDVLMVYNELTRIREQIEIIKGQIQYYEQSAALSSLSVDIQAQEAIQPLSIGKWEPVGEARDAVQALLNTLKFLTKAAIWIGLYILPVLIILSIPFVLIFLAIRRARRRKAAPVTTDQA
jgi:hypothetical protein